MVRKIISDWENNNGGYERELMVAYYNINHSETIRYSFSEGVVKKDTLCWESNGKEEVYGGIRK
ncbi:unnamed protein product [marine sediment metagenome]|uniref:Uncharacterized protein n=1 Tax=marine sediment metagenome TaxID=412755 RepID=X1BND8_9ZZZZ